MKTIHRLSAEFSVKSADDAGKFTGYASVFGVRDAYNEVVVKGAFKKSLATFDKKGRMPPLLWQHDSREPIGVWTLMREDDVGLYAEGQLLIDDDPLARRAYAHLKRKSISGLSIGFVPEEHRWNKEEQVTELTTVDLWETSIVTFPANDEARIGNVKARDYCRTIRDFEAILRDAGFSRDEAKALASRGWPALDRRDVDEAAVVELVTVGDRLLNLLRG